MSCPTIMEDERRHFLRIARGFLVRYRLPGEDSTSWWLSPLRDLSHGGARFLSEHTFTVGTVLDLQVVLPALEWPIVVKAKVTWVKPAPGQLVELGVLFEGLGLGAQQAIDEAVARFLRMQRFAE